MDTSTHPVLLFDGVCNLCDNSIQFLIKRDPKGIFRYAPLQSSIGEELLSKYGQQKSNLSTVVLIENDTIYTHSDVALRVFKRLGGLWPILYVFTLIPRPIRDQVYTWVANNRYRWFGQKEQCMIPTPDIKSRFLG